MGPRGSLGMVDGRNLALLGIPKNCYVVTVIGARVVHNFLRFQSLVVLGRGLSEFTINPKPCFRGARVELFGV